MCASKVDAAKSKAICCETASEDRHPQLKHQVQLAPYNEKYREDVLALLKAVQFKSEIWLWQFELNPYNKPFRPVIVTDADDQVVAFNGVMPINVTEHGRPLDAIWSCDFFVSAKHRGAGIGSLVKEELSDRAAIILALGVSDKAGQVLHHLGWHTGTRVFSFKRIRKKWPFRDLAVFLIQIKNFLLGRRRFKLSHRRSNQTISAQSQLPKKHEIEQLWSQVETGYEKVITRNYSYLDWKYQNHPMARYGFVVVREENELAAVVVVRFAKGTLRIVDYCGPAWNQGLKDRVVAFCQSHWKHSSQFSASTSDPELCKSLLAAGYYRSHTQPKFYVRTRPGKERADAEGWFLMGGDSDGELLLAARQFQEGA